MHINVTYTNSKNPTFPLIKNRSTLDGAESYFLIIIKF